MIDQRREVPVAVGDQLQVEIHNLLALRAVRPLERNRRRDPRVPARLANALNEIVHVGNFKSDTISVVAMNADFLAVVIFLDGKIIGQQLLYHVVGLRFQGLAVAISEIFDRLIDVGGEPVQTLLQTRVVHGGVGVYTSARARTPARKIKLMRSLIRNGSGKNNNCERQLKLCEQ